MVRVRVRAPGPKPAPDDRTAPAGRAARTIAAFGAALVFLSAAGHAQSPEQANKAEAVERELTKEREHSKELERKAKALAQETAAISRKMVSQAREARSLERQTASLKTRLEDIWNLEQSKMGELRRQHRKLARLLGALQRIARNPPEAMMAYADSARDVLRSAMLLRAVLPQLEAQADALKSELDSIGRLRATAAKRKADLDAASEKLSAKRRELDDLLRRKQALALTTRAEQERALARSAELASRARNLHGLLASIEQDRKRLKAMPPPAADPAGPLAGPDAPTPPKPPKRTRMAGQTQLALAPALRMSQARGRLVVPVVGRIISHYGRKEPIGTRIKGLRFEAVDGAQVVAPHAGQVVFAGEFRGYGRLLIIDHGEGYHTLLAGLGRIDVAVDQELLTGEPVGIMAPSGKGSPRLYLELRRNGRPVDPQPWLAATPNDKVSG